MSIIEACDLTYTFPKALHPVLSRLKFEIASGQVTALVGCSGSGKSTLLLALAGIVPEFYGGEWLGSLRIGEVTVTDEDPRSPEVVNQVAIVLQTPETQLIGFRVEETIAFGLENQGIAPDKIRHRVGEVLTELGITHLRYRLTDQLSGGQKQACVLAAMLALDTPIIVLDEPTSALDPAGKRLVSQVIERLKQLGKTLVIGDQNLDWFQHLVDRVLALSPTGQILFDGALTDFLEDRDCLKQARIPIPSLTALAHELQNHGYPVLPWVSLLDARTWLASRFNYESVQKRSNSQLAPSELVVECKQLTFTYPDTATPALIDVDLTAWSGRVLGIIGQNGSGKSTAIRHLNGLLRPQQGIVIVAGQNVAKKSVAQMARWIGIAFQNPDFMLFNETVEQEVLFSISLSSNSEWKQSRQAEMMVLMEQFGLMEQRLRSPLALSVGEKQMLTILCALALDPTVVVLDEPTFGMDQHGRQRLGQVLQALKAGGKAAICISHDLPLLAEYADEIVVFQQGRVECCRPTRELLSDGELFDRLNIPLPHHIQLANELLQMPCLTPTEFAHMLLYHVSPV